MSTSSFNALLNNLHGGSGRPLVDQESSYIEINTRRQFYVSSTYNTIIAYEGDTNSQLIVFNCPKYHENHDLSACTYKKLRWRNVAARTEGLSDLSTAANPNDTNAQLLTWTVPPEAFAKSGNIDLTISCYDLDASNKTAFAWNTGTFSELKVGKTIGVGGIQGNTGNQLRQAKNEILFIDLEHRNIVAPEDYNYIIASYGETGITKVYFETPKYFKGQDLSSATIKITATLGKTTTITTITASDKYTPFANDSNDQGLIGFVWSVPTDITCNAEYKTGAITFAIAFEITGGKIIRTSPYTNLRIRESYIKDSGPFSQSKSYFLDGNSNTISDTIESIGGIVKLRKDEDNSAVVNENELILCFDPSTKQFTGIKLGTADNQALSQAANIITGENVISALGFTPANEDDVLTTSNVTDFVRLVGGKIPSTYLPSYVDDVIFFENGVDINDPEITGEEGKIYFVKGATGGYRWVPDDTDRGGRFVLVTSILALGTTETTAYRGDHGLAAYNHSQVTTGNPHSVTATQTGALPTTGGTVTGPIQYKQGAETGQCSVSYDATKKCIKFSFS